MADPPGKSARPPARPRSQDSLAAAEIAAAAGETLLTAREQLLAGSDADLVGREGDRRSNERILSLLRKRFPNDAVLSEESADDPRRLVAPRVWIVDPLDGTREFTEPGRTDWAVHVALVEEGVLVAGAVALPADGAVYATQPAPPPPKLIERPLRIAVSRTRPATEAAELVRRLSGELVPLGSAGVKAIAVVRGEVDAYFHTGGQYEWDSAAPVAVACAAGLHASRVDGSALEYNNASPWIPDLLICRPDLAPQLLRELASITSREKSQLS